MMTDGEKREMKPSRIHAIHFWLYFGFVYGILFDDRIPARHLPWSQVYLLAR
jgi:hypothetical protein